MSHIELGLAVAIAGQVSLGLTPGDGQEERMAGALMVIGLMVKKAADDTTVNDVLDLTASTRIERLKDGEGWRISVVEGLE